MKTIQEYIEEIESKAEIFNNRDLINEARFQYDIYISKIIKYSPFTKCVKEKLNYHWYKKTGVV